MYTIKRRNRVWAVEVESDNKPASCRKCKIKICAEEKGLTLCDECTEFPCVLVKRLDKSYQKRYDESLVKI